jgi:glyceraldehyde 3-phosphate dehydrogenase
MINIAINGYGRIGRNILREIYSNKELKKEIKVVAINDLNSIEQSVYLTKYDSVHGKCKLEIKAYKSKIVVEDLDIISYFSEKSPENLPWNDLDVDIVLECTGLFTDVKSVQPHLNSGARRVLISAPSKNADATIVYGVNHKTLTGEETIVSNASCTTNCLAPIAKVLNDNFKITSGLMTTIHSYTGDQNLVDAPHGDMYRSRAAALSMIPTKTGAATALGLVIPELNGLVNGMAMRVPTANVSVVDFTCRLDSGKITKEMIDSVMYEASRKELKGILKYNEEPLVSIDFNGEPYSSIYDSNQTYIGKDGLIKVFAWYDNETGFSNRMIDTAIYWCKI